jgi:hypothetical protein
MQICTVADNQPGSGQWNRQPVGPGRALAIVSFDPALERRELLWHDPEAAMNGIEMPIEWQLPVYLTPMFIGLCLP